MDLAPELLHHGAELLVWWLAVLRVQLYVHVGIELLQLHFLEVAIVLLALVLILVVQVLLLLLCHSGVRGDWLAGPGVISYLAVRRPSRCIVLLLSIVYDWAFAAIA